MQWKGHRDPWVGGTRSIFVPEPASAFLLSGRQGAVRRQAQMLANLATYFGEIADQTRIEPHAINFPNRVFVQFWPTHSINVLQHTLRNQDWQMAMENATMLAPSPWWQVALSVLKATKRYVDSLWSPTLDVVICKYFSLSFKILQTDESL